jgi:glyoxylase-like metal-dependent hydrolase (beta-lactamase superfamily II)
VNKLALPVLALISLLGCGLVRAQDHDFSKVQMKVSKVAGNVYMLEGAGGNIGASVGDDGIVVVDDQYAPLADKIQAALKGITHKPVRFIINTHYHPDHTGSNEYFQKQAPIIAHDNVRKRLEAGGPAGNGGSRPFIDVDSGGSINGLIDAVEKVIGQLPPDAKIIPGHGPGLQPGQRAGVLDYAEGHA